MRTSSILIAVSFFIFPLHNLSLAENKPPSYQAHDMGEISTSDRGTAAAAPASKPVEHPPIIPQKDLGSPPNEAQGNWVKRLGREIIKDILTLVLSKYGYGMR